MIDRQTFTSTKSRYLPYWRNVLFFLLSTFVGSMIFTSNSFLFDNFYLKGYVSLLEIQSIFLFVYLLKSKR
jgi:hypothetical protein